jgi:hypothetical protein
MRKFAVDWEFRLLWGTKKDVQKFVLGTRKICALVSPRLELKNNFEKPFAFGFGLVEVFELSVVELRQW